MTISRSLISYCPQIKLEFGSQFLVDWRHIFNPLEFAIAVPYELYI